MSPNILTEGRLLLVSAATGMGLMAVYDIFRVLRLLIPHKSFFVGLEDFIYWIFSGLITFYLLYRENDGALRSYIIGGVLLSMVCYDRIFSQNFLKLLKKAGRCFRIKMLGFRKK